MTAATETLKRIHWQADAEPIASFIEARIPHGFLAKGIAPPPLTNHIRQIHGTRIVAMEHPGTGLDLAPTIEADGMVTGVRGVGLTIKTADCLPVLLADKAGQLVMAVHAGWRGLTAGILAEAVATFKGAGVLSSDVLVAIGPSVSQPAYEVGIDVVEALQQKTLGLTSEQVGFSLAKSLGTKWFADVAVAGAFHLTNLGIRPESLTVVRLCTRLNPTWASYRRDGANAGRNLSWISRPID